MSKMTRVLAVVLALGLVFAACGGSGGTDDGFSDEIRAEFMDGCVPGVGEAFCECALDELEQVYTEDEFVQAGLDAALSDSQDVPQEMLDAVTACIDKIEG